MDKVAVVIPNYNGKKYLCPCLEALYMNTVTEIKVLVIDNCSKDGSIEEAKQRFPQAEYLLLEKNYGFCRAVNIGIKRSRTPYVILLNNDTEIKEGFVEALLKAVKQNDRIFSVESKMIQYGDQSLIDSAGTFYNALGWAFARGKDKKGTGLGLSIVKEIIQLHGENINVVSTEGVGTEFIFSLSKVEEQANARQ